MPNLYTDTQMRNGIRNLMIERLGIKWAKVHVLAPYGHLNDIPRRELPKVYAKAQADALAMGDNPAPAAAPVRDTSPETDHDAPAIRKPERTALPDWPRGMGATLAAGYVGLSVSGLHRLRRAGDFPLPVQLTPGRLVWLREQLDAWLDARAKPHRVSSRLKTGTILDDLPVA